MAIVLFLFCALSFLAGMLTIGTAETVFQEIAGFILLLISTVLFVGGAIVVTIANTRKKYEPTPRVKADVKPPKAARPAQPSPTKAPDPVQPQKTHDIQFLESLLGDFRDPFQVQKAHDIRRWVKAMLLRLKRSNLHRRVFVRHNQRHAPALKTYFLSVEGKDSGPHSLEEIRGFRKSGVLTEDVLVFRSDEKEWQRANMFAEIWF